MIISEQVLHLREAKKMVDQAMRHLELLIMATPTSDARNALTESNIHLTEAKNKLTVYEVAKK